MLDKPAGNQRASTVSGANGNFTLKNLTVGKGYTITFTYVGYQSQVMNNAAKCRVTGFPTDVILEQIEKAYLRYTEGQPSRFRWGE